MSSQDTVVPPIPASPQLDQPSHTLNHDAANGRVADQAYTIDDGDIFNVSDMNDGARQPASFSAQVATYQAELDAHYREHEADIKQMSSSHLDPLDWDDLEARYQRAVSEKKAQEQVVMRDIETSFRHFMEWMQLSSERESQRGIKRLRTQAAFVKQSENEYNQRQDHYDKVLAAFQQAMMLLTHPV